MKILAVDDNKSILSAIELLLCGRYEKVKTLANPNMLLSELANDNYSVLLLDMNFSAGINTGNEGLYWLQRVMEAKPSISVVMITAYGDVALAVKAIQMGATDFVLKPWENDKLLAVINSACKLNESRNKVHTTHKKAENNVIGQSSAWQNVMQIVGKVASTDANVLITGENGTGKEVVAKELHRLSKRSARQMVTVDMGSITETLFESELFGHRKGAFTDAHTDREGKIETANQSTLFLDEIGNLSMQMQAKLLSVLQNRCITRVGDNKPIPVDIRLVCATNCNLEQMVAEGRFREDLLYRINTIHIELPPLRERKDDIRLLAEFFLQKFADQYNKNGYSFCQQTIQKLEEYTWPGNIRELQHAVEKAVILSNSNTIQPSDFMFRNNEPQISSPFEGTLEDMERMLIADAINKNNGNMSLVATQLGITRQTLYNKLKKYGL